MIGQVTLSVLDKIFLQRSGMTVPEPCDFEYWKTEIELLMKEAAEPQRADASL